MQRITVASSNIASIGYDADNQIRCVTIGSLF